MRPTYQVELVPLIELSHHVLPEYIAHTPVVVCPSLNIDLWVAPYQVAQKACIWNLLGPILFVDYAEVSEIRTQSSMHAQDSVVYNRSYGKHVEANGEVLPELHVIAPLAFVIEPVHSVDLVALVVASQQEHVIRELNLERQQQTDGLDALLPPVDVVSDEEELLVTTWVAGDVEEAEEIEELTVYVAENLDRRFDLNEQTLVLEVFGALIDQVLDGLLVEFYWLSPLTVFNFCELADDHVYGVLLLAIPLRC